MDGAIPILSESSFILLEDDGAWSSTLVVVLYRREGYVIKQAVVMVK